MTGKYIVFESAFMGRFAYREIVKETQHSYMLRRRDDEPERRLKGGLGPAGFFDSAEEAEQAAKFYTERCLKIRSEAEQATNELREDLQGSRALMKEKTDEHP